MALQTVGDIVWQRGEFLAQEIQHGIFFARQKQGGLQDLGAVQKGSQFPVAVAVPIVVQAAAEPRAAILALQEIQVGLGKPCAIIVGPR